jgi:hypothetical protein
VCDLRSRNPRWGPRRDFQSGRSPSWRFGGVRRGVLNCLCKRRVSQHGSPRSQYGCVIGARSFAQWAPPTASAFQPLAEVHEILNPSICNLEVAVERVLAGDRGEAGHKHNGIVGPVRKDPLAVR